MLADIRYLILHCTFTPRPNCALVTAAFAATLSWHAPCSANSANARSAASNVYNTVVLEDHLQPKLKFAGRASAEDLAGCPVVDGGVWRAKVDKIRHVERLKTELQVSSLAEAEVFEQCGVQAIVRRSLDDTHSRGAIGIGGRRSQGIRIEPKFRAWTWNPQALASYQVGARVRSEERRGG